MISPSPGKCNATVFLKVGSILHCGMLRYASRHVSHVSVSFNFRNYFASLFPIFLSPQLHLHTASTQNRQLPNSTCSFRRISSSCATLRALMSARLYRGFIRGLNGM